MFCFHKHNQTINSCTTGNLFISMYKSTFEPDGLNERDVQILWIYKI